MITVSACQYALEILPSWDHYVAKITALVEFAVRQNANILLLPEYAGIEIACHQYATDQALYAALQPMLDRYIAFYQELAERYALYIQAGTIMVADEDKYVNRAYFFGPKKIYGYQDKLQLTEYEKNCKILKPGNTQTVFETAFGKIGIAICYDSEFPEHVRNLTNAGAWLILVPSYTTTVAGYYRVYCANRARALENQCYVAVSHVVGNSDLSEPSETTVGRASLVGPIDVGFPDDGVIAQGIMNQVTMITADVSLEKLHTVRASGHVHNFEDARENKAKQALTYKNLCE